MPDPKPRFRCGDVVRHRPSGEDWTVAWCEGDDLAWCGYPNGIARTSDCDLIKAATDDDHAEWAKRVARGDDSRADKVRRLYADVLGGSDA